VLTVGAAVAFGVWWSTSRPPRSRLAPGWPSMVSVIAGDGVSAFRDGQLSRARFSDPYGIAVGADRTVFIADAGEAQRIRGISPEGVVFTLAGGDAGFADGVGSAARFDSPSGLAIDPNGALIVADTGNNAIRRVSRNGEVTTIAGDGTPGHRDGPASQARFNGPIGIAVDAAGRILVADTYNDRIRVIAADGSVSTLAGADTPGAADGRGADARFDTPCALAVDAAGNVHVADTGNGLVRVIDPTGHVRTSVPPPEGLVRPAGIAVSPGGDAYVTDDRGRVAEITAAGTARILAGSSPGFREGAGSEARFRGPTGVAWAGPGRLIVSDSRNALVRAITAISELDLRLPPSPGINPHFDPERFGRFPLLWPVAPMEGPHEIAGTIGEARGGEGSERFHAGIDVRVEQGTPVLAVRDGIVSSPIANDEFGSLNEWLRIGPIAYVHVRTARARVGRDDLPFDVERFVPTYDDLGKLVRIRVKRGARFRTGDVIATANQFNHVHLNVGWPGEEFNPLVFRLVQFEDSISPAIARGGVRLFDALGQPLNRRHRGRVLVSGHVQVVVDAWDQADGNRPSRRLGLYALGYEILHRDGSPIPGHEGVRDTITFDRLSDPDGARLVYAPGSGIPFYGRRVTRFLYAVTNTFRDGIARPGYWDTSGLTPGDYIVRAWASDIRGNSTNRDLPVTIVSAEPEPNGRGR
jgi:sugar lactone lactonase YvrE